MNPVGLEALQDLARDIDSASDTGARGALEQLDRRCAEMLAQPDEANAATVWYYRSNVQAALQRLDDPQSWKWRQPHREREILYLRKSRGHQGFPKLDPVARARIATNLANNLNALGRSIEAMAVYNEALRYEPRFAMALGNRGWARLNLARALHDRGHAIVILTAAHDDLSGAASSGALWESHYPGVREEFLEKAKEIERAIDLTAARRTFKLDAHSLGRSARERKYRRWALERDLFINPLNVLGAHSIAATDRFGLPDHRVQVGDPPQFIAWFNQLKQEYAAARLLLYEADQDAATHFANRELMLVDTLDYPAFGISIEKLRLAFRIAYGLLDKVSGFINIYFSLGENPKRVDLRHVWLTKDRGSIRAEFAERPNLPLRGLYWLAFDILGTEPGDADAIAPEAIELYKLRNALEHRCLVLRHIEDSAPMGIVETLSVSVFADRALTMVKLARASLMYLSLAMHREEQIRRKAEPGLAVSIPLPTYPRWPPQSPPPVAT